MLGLEMRTAPLGPDLRVDPVAAESLIDDATVGLVGVVGTTEYGMVDPIPALSAIAEEHDLLLHVDAAFGGLVVPFLPDPPPFDFSLGGVSTIAVDPHKMGMSTIPAGCLLVRDRDLLGLLNVDTPYLTVKQEYTLAGTRPGAPVVGAWAVLEHLGREGMRAVVAGCMENARRLTEGLEAFGVERAATPDVNVATFRTASAPPGWRVSFTRRGDMRIVCMPHVTGDVVERFLVDAEAYYV
jgi:tyrosine decarboxylase/aspartate 1-decarboxylase